MNIKLAFEGEVEDFIGLFVDPNYSDIKQELQAMAKSINDISASIGELRTTITEEHTQVAEALATLQTKIDDLSALVEASGTQEQIEAAIGELQTAKDEVSHIYDAPEAPTT